MSRYIDADKIDFNECFVGQSDFARDTREAAQNLIDKQPTADVEPVRHGHWIISVFDESVFDKKEGGKESECSYCKNVFPYWKGALQIGVMPYCPKCGAKMDEEVE